MADCIILPICPFFKDRIKTMPIMVAMIIKRYCKGDFENCARYMLYKYKGKLVVPNSLFPNHVEKANEIIEKGLKQKIKEKIYLKS